MTGVPWTVSHKTAAQGPHRPRSRRPWLWAWLLLSVPALNLGAIGSGWAADAHEAAAEAPSSELEAARTILEREANPVGALRATLLTWAGRLSAGVVAGYAAFQGVPTDAVLGLSLDAGQTLVPYLELSKEATRAVLAGAGGFFTALGAAPVLSAWRRGTQLTRAARFWQQAQAEGHPGPSRSRSPTAMAAGWMVATSLILAGGGAAVTHALPDGLVRSRAYAAEQLARPIAEVQLVLAPMRVKQAKAPAAQPTAAALAPVEEPSLWQEVGGRLRVVADGAVAAATEKVKTLAIKQAVEAAKGQPLEGLVRAVLLGERHEPKGGVSVPLTHLATLATALVGVAGFAGLRLAIARKAFRREVAGVLRQHLKQPAR